MGMQREDPLTQARAEVGQFGENDRSFTKPQNLVSLSFFSSLLVLSYANCALSHSVLLARVRVKKSDSDPWNIGIFFRTICNRTETSIDSFGSDPWNIRLLLNLPPSVSSRDSDRLKKVSRRVVVVSLVLTLSFACRVFAFSYSAEVGHVSGSALGYLSPEIPHLIFEVQREHDVNSAIQFVKSWAPI